MLALKLGISLPSLRPLGWSPADDATLVAWYKNRTGLTVGVGISPNVSAWADSSANSYDMVQATSSEQPSYTVASGILTFVSANDENLQTVGQISLTGDFTIGIRLNPAIAAAGTFLADNTTSNELFKFESATRIKVKIDSANKNLDLDSGTFGDDYVIITRVSDVLNLWHNGTLQTGTTPTAAGTSDIDAIGIRATDADAYDGTIQEIQIYGSSSAELTEKVNTRLATL